MTDDQQKLVDAVRRESPSGLLRSMMSKSERKAAAELVLSGVLKKGIADIARHPVAYFLSA